MRILLYTTLGCHLCDEAFVMLHRFKQNQPETEISEIEISESDDLMEAYGVRIPVVRNEISTLELGWPFSFEELAVFLTPDQTSTPTT